MTAFQRSFPRALAAIEMACTADEATGDESPR
jgi:hypothetical protein